MMDNAKAAEPKEWVCLKGEHDGATFEVWTNGRLKIEVGGSVHVRTIKEWHDAAVKSFVRSETPQSRNNEGTITVCGYSFPARIMGVPDYPSRSFQHEAGFRTVPWDDWADMQKRLTEAVEVITNLQAQAGRSETRQPVWVAPTDRQPDLDGRLWAVLTERRENGKLTGFVPLFEYYHFDNGWATDDRILFWLDAPMHPLPKVPHE